MASEARFFSASGSPSGREQGWPVVARVFIEMLQARAGDYRSGGVGSLNTVDSCTSACSEGPLPKTASIPVGGARASETNSSWNMFPSPSRWIHDSSKPANASGD